MGKTVIYSGKIMKKESYGRGGQSFKVLSDDLSLASTVLSFHKQANG